MPRAEPRTDGEKAWCWPPSAAAQRSWWAQLGCLLPFGGSLTLAPLGRSKAEGSEADRGPREANFTRLKPLLQRKRSAYFEIGRPPKISGHLSTPLIPTYAGPLVLGLQLFRYISLSTRAPSRGYNEIYQQTQNWIRLVVGIFEIYRQLGHRKTERSPLGFANAPPWTLRRGRLAALRTESKIFYKNYV